MENFCYPTSLLICQINWVLKKTLKLIQRTLEISTDGFWISRSLILQVLGWQVFFLLESVMQLDWRPDSRELGVKPFKTGGGGKIHEPKKREG